MVPIYNKKYNYLMLYVPKAACCVMRRTYVDFHLEEFTTEQRLTLQDRKFHGLAGIHSGNKITPETFYNTPRFAIVRNPYERSLSAYYDKFLHLRNKSTWKTTKLNNLFNLFASTQDLNYLKTLAADDTIHKSNLTFDQYIKTINLDINVLSIDTSFVKYLEFLNICKINNINSFDEHHDTQSSISNKFSPEKVFKDLKVVHIENYETELKEAVKDIFNVDDFQKYMNLFKINSTDPATRNASAKRVTLDINGSSLSRDYFIQRMNKEKTILDTQTMINKHCEQLIYNFYKQDFDLFNYTRRVILK